jgi:hypothetical protein
MHQSEIHFSILFSFLKENEIKIEYLLDYINLLTDLKKYEDLEKVFEKILLSDFIRTQNENLFYENYAKYFEKIKNDNINAEKYYKLAKIN